MATEIIVQRRGPRLVGATLIDAEALEELKHNTDYRANLTRPNARSVKHHRLLFGMIKIIRDNYPEPLSPKAVLNTLKLLTGHVEPIQLLCGLVVQTPSSISFEAMDQDEFNAWFKKAVDVMCREFAPGMSAEVAVREIEAIAYGRAAA